jgi:pyrroloquinoline quinone biosynthesis protein E
VSAAVGVAPRPYTLVAELTYACPLACPYCSNPVDFAARRAELTTDDWASVFEQAAALGVMQLHLTGGEPLVRKDLEALVVRAHAVGLYTNLVTSGLPLTRERLKALGEAGVDHVQLSVQDATAKGSDTIAGTESFEQKTRVAAWLRDLAMPFTLNVVLHRGNLDHIEEILAMGERLGANRLELANTQYLGWALENRARLMPTREQLAVAYEAAERARARLRGKVEVVFVKPDYFGKFPRACMDGWAQRFLLVSPEGLALPCHAAHTIPGLVFEDVRGRPLAEIWGGSPGLEAFRGEGWMPEPCQSCDRRSIDFGGCRCQAFHLTGDAAATDPACHLAPTHALIDRARTTAADGAYIYRGSLRRAR